MPNIGYGELLMLAVLILIAVIFGWLALKGREQPRAASGSTRSHGHIRYYYQKSGRLIGPFDRDRLRECLSRKSIEADTPVSPDSGPGSDPTNRTWLPLRVALPQLVNGVGTEAVVPTTESVTTDRSHNTLAFRPNASKPVLYCAIGLLAAFFMPWVQLFGLGLSGYSLGKLGSYGNYAWVIPILAGATIWTSFSGANNRAVGILTGIVPLVAIFYGLVRIGGEGGPEATDGILNLAGHVLAIGAWLTIALSVAIILAALTPPNAATEARPELAARLHATNASRPVSHSSGPPDRPTDGISAEVARLAKLHADGVLSPEEFKSAKAKLLA